MRRSWRSAAGRRRRGPPVALHQEHDLLEGEEADGQREEDVQFRADIRSPPDDAVMAKSAYLNQPSRAEVETDAGDQPAPGCTPVTGPCQMQDPLAAAIIGDDRAGQQCDEPGIPPAVEEQALAVLSDAQ